ncbi:MAG: PIG-L family deacetylase [Chloroflexota bacterium]|nr:PIG-L family deacetylase [Chloroflexota bacterium]
MSYPIAPGGLAAVLAHPDDESFGCAGALAIAHDAGATTRLLVVTRGEAGSADADSGTEGDQREAELICAARAIGLDEVSLLDGYADGGVADQPFDQLVEDIAAWLTDRRPAAVITFGPHGVTGHPDHIVVGNATRWAVERLADAGIAPNAVYVISPIFDPSGNRYDLSAEEQAATHRIEITHVAGRKVEALRCHTSQSDVGQELAALRAAMENGRPIYEAYGRVRPLVPAPHPDFDEALL